MIWISNGPAGANSRHSLIWWGFLFPRSMQFRFLRYHTIKAWKLQMSLLVISCLEWYVAQSTVWILTVCSQPPTQPTLLIFFFSCSLSELQISPLEHSSSTEMKTSWAWLQTHFSVNSHCGESVSSVPLGYYYASMVAQTAEYRIRARLCHSNILSQWLAGNLHLDNHNIWMLVVLAHEKWLIKRGFFSCSI